MKTWEVIIPPAGGGALQRLVIEAPTSMMALSEGLRQISDPAQLSSLICKILPHGDLEVVDSRGGRTIVIRELDSQPQGSADARNRSSTQAVPPPASPQPGAPRPDCLQSEDRHPGALRSAGVPPPDPSAASSTGQSSSTSVGLPVLGGRQQPSSNRLGRRRRTTREISSAASGISTGQGPATPASSQITPSTPAAPSPQVIDATGAPAAHLPAPPSPTANHLITSAPPPTAQIPAVSSMRSSGEVVGTKPEPEKPITEPAIILDDHLQAEIQELENLRRAREAAMTPPAMRPIPHKVFKVIAEAPDAPRFETVRRRYVSVWPNPPHDALEEVLRLQLAQVQTELARLSGAKRILVAAFDHAFEKIPLRPPLGICTWTKIGEGEPETSLVYGKAAADLWSPTHPPTGEHHSPVMAPALNPEGANLAHLGANTGDDVKTALMAAVDADGNPITASSMTIQAVTGAPSESASTPAAAPSLEQQTSAQPPATAQPPTAMQPPAPATAQPQPAAAPPAAAPTDLLSLAFQRFQPLFYVTDRQQAFAFAIDTALGLVPSQAGVLLLYDYQARDLYSAIIRAPSGAPVPGYRSALADGVAGFCATQGLPLALSRWDEDTRFSSVLGTQCGLDVFTLAGAPVQYQGHLFGVLELANRQAGGTYTSDELNALAYIGRQLAERLSTTLSS